MLDTVGASVQRGLDGTVEISQSEEEPKRKKRGRRVLSDDEEDRSDDPRHKRSKPGSDNRRGVAKAAAR